VLNGRLSDAISKAIEYNDDTKTSPDDVTVSSNQSNNDTNTSPDDVTVSKVINENSILPTAISSVESTASNLKRDDTLTLQNKDTSSYIMRKVLISRRR